MSEDDKQSLAIGVGCLIFLPLMLTVTFLFLKWGGVTDMSYFWVIAPCLFSGAFLVIFAICEMVYRAGIRKG